jgi:hypothetical protein
MIATLFSNPASGTCLYCGGDRDDVITPAGNIAKLLELGVCDTCSYTLLHAWRRARGEIAAAVTPALIRTYVLLPRLQKGRAEEDLSAYDFLVDAEGGLPKFYFSRDPREVISSLSREHGVVTWLETLRPCYQGYDSRGDFSEVLLAWAWGKIPEAKLRKFGTFGDLLKMPGPDAGFYLGVKQAFEGLLAKRELAPETNKVCVVLREPAMRYFNYQNYASGRDPGEGHEDEDKAMIDLCHAAMSSDELAVLSLLEDAARRAAEAASAVGKLDVSPRVRPRSTGVVNEDGEGGDEGDGGEDGEEQEPAEGDVPEGFARPPRRLSGGEP